MATNVELNYFDGSKYEILYPKISLEYETGSYIGNGQAPVNYWSIPNGPARNGYYNEINYKISDYKFAVIVGNRILGLFYKSYKANNYPYQMGVGLKQNSGGNNTGTTLNTSLLNYSVYADNTNNKLQWQIIGCIDLISSMVLSNSTSVGFRSYASVLFTPEMQLNESNTTYPYIIFNW